MMDTIRVATFNIRNGRAFDGFNSWPFRRSTTSRAINSLGADVVGLQEVFIFQLQYLLHRSSQFEAVGTARSKGKWGEQCPILTNEEKIKVVDHKTLWFGNTPTTPGTRLEGATFPRIATIATLEIEGKTIQVTNTHLDERIDNNRKQSLSQLIEWLDLSLPQVIMGDLNAEPNASSLDYLKECGFQSVLEPTLAKHESAYSAQQSLGTAHNFTGRTDGACIDHIFVNEHFKVINAYIKHFTYEKRLPSDHWPIVANLELQS